MAKGRARRGGGNGSGEAAISDADRIINAAASAIAEFGWRRLSLAEIATRAELPIITVYRNFTSKHAVLCGLFQRVDETALAEVLEPEADERPRDRVFDLLMRRFDALKPYKTTLEILRRELPSDPAAALVLGHRLCRSVGWMLEAGGIVTTGISGVIAVKLTTAAYLAAQRVWLTDESPDLAPTMATLDRRLRGIERWLSTGRSYPRGAAAPA